MKSHAIAAILSTLDDECGRLGELDWDASNGRSFAEHPDRCTCQGSDASASTSCTGQVFMKAATRRIVFYRDNKRAVVLVPNYCPMCGKKVEGSSVTAGW